MTSGESRFELDASTVGELRAAVEAMAGVPDETPFYVRSPVEIKIGQPGNRVHTIITRTPTPKGTS